MVVEEVGVGVRLEEEESKLDDLQEQLAESQYLSNSQPELGG